MEAQRNQKGFSLFNLAANISQLLPADHYSSIAEEEQTQADAYKEYIPAPQLN